MSQPHPEDEPISPDSIQIDPSFIYRDLSLPSNLMEDLRSNEELTDDRISKLMQQFLSGFSEQYSNFGPSLYMGSLDNALTKSVYNQSSAQPLILFLYHGRTMFTNFFCRQVLCANDITDYIEKNFIVWAWDRTNDVNYQKLLAIVNRHLGDEIKEQIASLPTEKFPALICLAYNNAEIQITNVIQGCASHCDALESLKEARDRFDCRIETPHSPGPLWKLSINEVWQMKPSVLHPIEKLSEEFERVAGTYARQKEHVVEISKVENPPWLFQYNGEERSIRERGNHGQIEEYLLYPCSQTSAQYILTYGFNNDHKVNGSSNPNALLVCRVLIGQTRHRDETTRANPFAYDSVTDGSGTYILDSSRKILPIYYIKYGL
ncbi:unnamed protein product [Adineta ricciae]|uniref:UAS domain-containing protein n=1 Tax=Adineta ricciae TaxID=249248 RepID=A0A814D466_ADIRI|nr:unnamed protein product [Adineta ricciae]CAF1392288.1 unnamed protein product [Adineta ricciae]